MNIINKQPIGGLGYHFIPSAYIPAGKDEYYLRDKQNRSDIQYRLLREEEIKILERNANQSDNWGKLMVSDGFDPNLVKNCSFYGLVRIGKLEAYYHEFNNLRQAVGLYNSTIVSCDIGDNAAIDHVNYMSHYIVGNDVMLANINELATTNHSKFGNGVLKEGEKESVRIWLELCNENGGRSVLPFNGMLPADAWIWSKFRDNETLLRKFKEFTDKKYDTHRGYYGKIGDRTVIKHCRIIKDTWIGTDAYIKGANKLKNLTINSEPNAKTQIGEGCELVNGIIGYGCRIFYGVKAVRFVMGSNSQLKYGARLINSYLGDNSTISCCEVLNSMIFPAHEQHHNNSFLCAATVMGQSNMAAGATIGSNHNSRGADGELIAGRGFWPGLCVSLKHNSRFASYTLITKSDYPAELDIPIPFCLVSNDVSGNKLLLIPGYWFLYNMYALTRNAGKYASRDRRVDRSISIEYDHLAPDTVNEIFKGMALMEKFTGKAWAKKNNKKWGEKQYRSKGRELLLNGKADKLEIVCPGFENSERPVLLLKASIAYQVFIRMIRYYGICQLLELIESKNISNWKELEREFPAHGKRAGFRNAGGQLMKEDDLQELLKGVCKEEFSDWDQVHAFYAEKSHSYARDKFEHSFHSLLEVMNLETAGMTRELFRELLKESIVTRSWILEQIITSRSKDYENEFRKMVFDTNSEMEKVLGSLEDNSFIKEQRMDLEDHKTRIEELLRSF